MSQTKAGVQKIIEKYGLDHFKKVGSLGGNPYLMEIHRAKLNKENSLKQ